VGVRPGLGQCTWRSKDLIDVIPLPETVAGALVEWPAAMVTMNVISHAACSLASKSVLFATQLRSPPRAVVASVYDALHDKCFQIGATRQWWNGEPTLVDVLAGG
jgi:hypothetical protein